MAFESTVWNKPKKEVLIFGYIRQHQSDKYLVKDLKYLILKFYDEMIYWTFKEGDDMEYFLNYPNEKEIKGPVSEIAKGIIFQLTISPNGYSNEQLGYVQFYCDCIDAAKDDFTITAYIVFSCKQINYQHRVTAVFEYKKDCAGWAKWCMPLQLVKDSGYTSLDFGCYVELLHVDYFEMIEKEKNELESDNENGDKNPDDLKLVSSWTLPITMHKNYEFEWMINGELLQKMKNCRIGEHFYSDNFNNDSFCIGCSPKGWYDVNKNTFSFGITLFRLPTEIARILIYLNMESSFMNHNVEEMKVLEYAQCTSEWPIEDKYRYDSKLIDDISEIKIKCIINITDLQLFEVDEHIDEGEWMKYGVID